MHRAGGLRFHRWTRGFRQWHRIFIDGRPRASAGQQLAHLPRWVSAPITVQISIHSSGIWAVFTSGITLSPAGSHISAQATNSLVFQVRLLSD